MTLDKNSKIYIAGHRGIVRFAILRKLKFEGYTNWKYHTELPVGIAKMYKWYIEDQYYNE